MDWLLWVVRAIIIVVGIIIIWKGKKVLSFRFLAIGVTVLSLGVILLIAYFITDLSLFYALYLIGVGAIAIIIGYVIRSVRAKNR